jgi:hypothetical protein
MYYIDLDKDEKELKNDFLQARRRATSSRRITGCLTTTCSACPGARLSLHSPISSTRLEETNT